MVPLQVFFFCDELNSAVINMVSATTKQIFICRKLKIGTVAVILGVVDTSRAI